MRGNSPGDAKELHGRQEREGGRMWPGSGHGRGASLWGGWGESLEWVGEKVMRKSRI